MHFITHCKTLFARRTEYGTSYSEQAVKRALHFMFSSSSQQASTVLTFFYCQAGNKPAVSAIEDMITAIVSVDKVSIPSHLSY